MNKVGHSGPTLQISHEMMLYNIQRYVIEAQQALLLQQRQVAAVRQAKIAIGKMKGYF